MTAPRPPPTRDYGRTRTGPFHYKSIGTRRKIVLGAFGTVDFGARPPPPTPGDCAKGASMVRLHCPHWALATPAPHNVHRPLSTLVASSSPQVHRCVPAWSRSRSGLGCGCSDSTGAGVHPGQRSLLIWARTGRPHSAQVGLNVQRRGGWGGCRRGAAG